LNTSTQLLSKDRKEGTTPDTIKILKAGQGDSIIISFTDDSNCRRNILIDGGNKKTEYENNLRQEVLQIASRNEKIDLLIITHIDQDHIKGINYLISDFENPKIIFNESIVCEYWFNSSKSIAQSSKFNEELDISFQDMQFIEKFLKNKTDKWQNKISSFRTVDFYNSKITILTPNLETLNNFIQKYPVLDISDKGSDYNFSLQELSLSEIKKKNEGKEELDTNLENATSISFLFEYKDKKILFLGDAIPIEVENGIKKILEERKLEKLVVDYIKLSHHGSRKSISYNFFNLIECSDYIISTNGTKCKLPNKATFSKILMNTNRKSDSTINFHFNYPSFSNNLKFTTEEKIHLKFNCFDSNYHNGLIITI